MVCESFVMNETRPDYFPMSLLWCFFERVILERMTDLSFYVVLLFRNMHVPSFYWSDGLPGSRSLLPRWGLRPPKCLSRVEMSSGRSTVRTTVRVPFRVSCSSVPGTRVPRMSDRSVWSLFFNVRSHLHTSQHPMSLNRNMCVKRICVTINRLFLNFFLFV